MRVLLAGLPAATSGRAPAGQPSAWIEAGLPAEFLTPAVDDPRAWQEDDWVHLTLDLTGYDDASGRWLSQELADAPTVSVALVGDFPSDRAETALDDLGDILARAGEVAALAFVAEGLLTRLVTDDDPGECSAGVEDELAQGLAESSGVTLLVTVGPERVTAVKPDGRLVATPVTGGPTEPDADFCAHFLASWLADPSDLAKAMGAAVTGHEGQDS